MNPSLLNIVLTFDCNMNCVYCVARDFDECLKKDLEVSKELINAINSSPFNTIVITGGEPMLKQDALKELISGITHKNIIIDTNGTTMPNSNLIEIIRKKNIQVRVSLDSSDSTTEIKFRKITSNNMDNYLAYCKKVKNIMQYEKSGIDIAVQSVLFKVNESAILELPPVLQYMKIKNWYVQALIPTKKLRDRYYLAKMKYNDTINALRVACKQSGINLIAKTETRFNSVFILVGNKLYTQHKSLPNKVCLGDISGIKDYFIDVCPEAHRQRYAEMETSNT
jgi:7-carboxy-7-deazaguanine synthase